MRRRRVLMAAMTVANAMTLLDQTSVPLSLPSIMHDFDIGSQTAQWALNASLLPLAALLVLGGRMGDLFGRRRVFLIGCVLFTVFSALGAAAPVFALLLACRVVQGVGGALMLPNTIAILSAAVPVGQRGSALGTMGGLAAVAGALGPGVGGILSGVFGWRSVLLVNVALGGFVVATTLAAIPAERAPRQRAKVDLSGAALLATGLVGLVFALSQSQQSNSGSPTVLIAVAVSVVSAIAFCAVERRSASPLVSFSLLRDHPHYLAATIAQLITGLAEMGLALLFSLLLILNLGMPPALAGLALIPSTLPMVILGPMAGRWYDRVGGRRPLLVGFSLLALSGGLLAVGIGHDGYLPILPGLLVFGSALALILTVNDPVSLEGVPTADHGEASGVSATAEQLGGAIGISGLYLAFHSGYVARLNATLSTRPGMHPSQHRLELLKGYLLRAEQSGLHAADAKPSLRAYLRLAGHASDHGYTIAMLAVSGCALLGLVITAVMLREPVSGTPSGVRSHSRAPLARAGGPSD